MIRILFLVALQLLCLVLAVYVMPVSRTQVLLFLGTGALLALMTLRVLVRRGISYRKGG